MFKKSSSWLMILACIVAFGFLATGCAKKAIFKEEAAGRPAPTIEAKKEAPPAPLPPPKEEAKPAPPAPAPPAPAPPAPPAPAPKVEAAPPAAPEAIDLASLRLQFAFDDDSLSTQSKEKLEKLAVWMKKGTAKIQIEGHTCDIGSNEYNLALGQHRAESAKTYLESLGISSSRLSTISYGEERPIVPNSNEANRSKNRRDEFVMGK